MQATMLKARLPHSGMTTVWPLLVLHKSFISGHGSVRLLPMGPRAALRGKRKSCSIKAITKENSAIDTRTVNIKRSDYPEDFFFGVASSAYQYEGAAREGGKGESNWDHFTRVHPDKIKDGSNANVTVDSYHRYKEHVALMKDMGLNSYRFSIAWTRILPTGKLSGGVNEEGIQYYNNLINELISQGIQPFVTLFHWDVPQTLEDEYGGFLNSKIVDDFLDYIDICYDRFGDRVKHWITLNEPLTFTVEGYVNALFPPGAIEDLSINPYLVAHNSLLAHAAAVHLYRTKYQSQGGKVGISLNCMHMVPFSDTYADIEAAQRASDFAFAWFMNPITFGRYPESMRHLVRGRLPNFSEEESKMLEGSYDFLGLNYYTAKYVIDAPSTHVGSYATDGCYKILSRVEGIPIGELTASEWLHIYPQGMHDVLLSIKEKYNDPVIYISENGISDHNSLSKEESCRDDKRVKALQDHLSYVKAAMDVGADVKGFFVWSLLDNFEWNVGFTARFGIHYIDFNDADLKPYPKDSAIWFKKFLTE
ncbi:beta-glucosidase 24-like [Macadamia integrifolia]|uniref:beta-glucosidase 24-like n=1 Tax=Macadamia integrifolia TaxID=60698 RepID=UPI001C500006|nr:beta-glucosidase 24-like [Macadamia integrifolia]